MAGMIDDIRARGTVRIGVSLGGEPIGFRDAQNNPVGYDVDVATLLAEKLGVPVEFTDVSGDARVSMLVSGQLDIVVANTSATLERAKSVNFSIPYNRAGLRIIVQKDAGITTLEGLAGKKVVVGRGTTGETFLKAAAPEAELVYTDNFSPEGVLLLQQKRVDAAIEDSSLARLSRHHERHAGDPAGAVFQRSDRHCRRQGRCGIRALDRHVRVRIYPVGRL